MLIGKGLIIANDTINNIHKWERDFDFQSHIVHKDRSRKLKRQI